MIEAGYYIVNQAVAIRCGSIENYHRIKDGRFIVTSRQLNRITLTPKELISGISGIEQISRNAALALIAQNDYKKGADPYAPAYVKPEEEIQEEDLPMQELQNEKIKELNGSQPSEAAPQEESSEESAIEVAEEGDEDIQESDNQENKEE